MTAAETLAELEGDAAFTRALDRFIERRARNYGEVPMTRAQAVAFLVEYLDEGEALDVIADRSGPHPLGWGS